MSTAALIVGILVGWAAVVCCNCRGHANPWVNRALAIIGGLIGAYLAGTIGSGDPIVTAIWAAAGAIVVCDLAGLLMNRE